MPLDLKFMQQRLPWNYTNLPAKNINRKKICIYSKNIADKSQTFILYLHHNRNGTKQKIKIKVERKETKAVKNIFIVSKKEKKVHKKNYEQIMKNFKILRDETRGRNDKFVIPKYIYYENGHFSQKIFKA